MAENTGKRGRRNGRNSSNRAQPWEPLPRDLEVHSMVCAGTETQQEIGDKFGITKSAVCKIAKKVDAWLTPQWMDSIRDIKARHAESLMHLFRESMRAWEKSKEDALTTTEETGDGIKKTFTRRSECGNPAFLSQARAALQDIRKIWGADDPIEHRRSDELRVAGLSRSEMYARLAEHFESMARVNMN